MAGAFDGASQGALMLGTGARLPARADLAVIRNKAPEYVDLFIVNYGVFVCAKLAFTRAGEKTPGTAARIRIGLVTQEITPRDRTERSR